LLSNFAEVVSTEHLDCESELERGLEVQLKIVTAGSTNWSASCQCAALISLLFNFLALFFH